MWVKQEDVSLYTVSELALGRGNIGKYGAENKERIYYYFSN